MSEDNKQTSKELEVEWNLAGRQLGLIGNLLDKSSYGYVNLDQRGWFYPLKSIKLQVVSRLTSEERKDLADYEKEILFLFGKKIQNPDSILVNNKDKVNRRNAAITTLLNTKIEVYETRLKEILEAKGYLVPLKPDRSNIFDQAADPDDIGSN